MRNIPKRILSQATWLSMLIGSAITGQSSAQVVAPLSIAEPRSQIADVAALTPNTAVRQPAQAPVITTGPVYAYGPVIQRAKPRQRGQTPNLGGQNFSRYNNYRRYNGIRTAGPYRMYQSPDYLGPQRYTQPRYDRNATRSAMGYPADTANSRGSTGFYSSPYGNYRGQWARPQNPNAFAWSDRGGPQTEGPNWARQPGWRN
jgi:hypothetical protein